MGICYNCNKKVLPEFNVCPYCGVKLTIEDEEYETVSREGITIEFNYSSSQSFEFALKSAQKFNTFKKFGSDKKAIYRVNIPENEIESLSELIENLKGWRNRRVYLNGEQIQWDEIFNYSWCFNQKKKSYKPELYCFGSHGNIELNIWGCVQTQLHFSEYSELFKFGNWLNNEGDWQFDKDKIKHYVESDLFEFRFCPAMNSKFLNEVIESFPNVVNPNKDKNWKFLESDYEDDEEVCLKIKVNRYGEDEILNMRCVVPKKKKAILKEINDKLKIKFPEKLISS